MRSVVFGALAVLLGAAVVMTGGCLGQPTPRARSSIKVAAIVWPGGGGSPATLSLYRSALEVNRSASDFDLSIVQVTPNEPQGVMRESPGMSPAVTALEQAMGQESLDLVLFSSPMEYAAAVDKGLLQPLDGFLRSDRTVKLEDFFPGAVEGLVDDGQLYGLPLSVSVSLLQYDRRAFDAAGVRYPEGSWSWTTFVNTLQAVTRVTGNPQTDQYGMGDLGPSFLLSLIWQNGGEIVSKDGRRSQLAEGPAIEAVQFYQDLSRRYKVMPSPYRPGPDSPVPLGKTIRVNPGEVPPLLSPMGRVAVSMNYGVGMPGYRGPGYVVSGAERPIRLVQLPRGKTESTSVDVNNILSLTANAGNQRLAYKALLALSAEMSKDLGVPTQRGLAKALKSNPYVTEEDLQVITASLEHSRSLPVRNRDKVMRALSSKLFSPLQAGEKVGSSPGAGKPVAELAREAAEAVDNALNGVDPAPASPAGYPAVAPRR